MSFETAFENVTPSGIDCTYLGLGSTYLRSHDDFAVGPTQDTYYLDPDFYQKCEELSSNQPLFLVSNLRHLTYVELILTSRMGTIEIEVL